MMQLSSLDSEHLYYIRKGQSVLGSETAALAADIRLGLEPRRGPFSHTFKFTLRKHFLTEFLWLSQTANCPPKLEFIKTTLVFQK